MTNEMRDELIARIASVEKKYASSRNMWNQLFGLLPLGGIGSDNTSGNGKASEDIVDSGNHTLRIMPFATVPELESTVRIEFFAVVFCSRKDIPGTVHGIDRPTVPQKLIVLRPVFIGQANGIVEYVTKDPPIDLTAGLAEGAVVNRFGIGPEPTAFSISEKLT
jgi:hypothetical protein